MSAMKQYEIYSQITVSPSNMIILRLDGRGFHNLTSNLNLNKPYDVKFRNIMINTAKQVFMEFQPHFIYLFSDELNILLKEMPFNGRIEKLNSVFASYTSSVFQKELLKFIPNLNELPIVSFDSRIIPLTKETIPKYFKSRQDEAWRNCINGHTYWLLRESMTKKEANEKINGLKSGDMHELMFSRRGINLSDFPNWQKRGIGIYKIMVEIEGYNPKKQIKTKSFRKKIKIDCNLPLFDNPFFKDNFDIK